MARHRPYGHPRRKRPLTEFARRSPLHALAVWLFRTAVMLLVALAAWLIIANVLIPAMVDGFVRQMRTP